MKRALLTGGTGFVGANLARRLLADGHEVHLLVRESYTGWRIDAIRGDVRLHTVDMLDAEALNGVVAQVKPEWVFHLAAHGAYSWQTDVRRILDTNLTATMNLVEACLKTGFEAFVNTGSSSEYGYKDHAPAEDEPVEPNSHYAVFKASATMFCRFTAQRERVHLPTLRLYSVYGPFEEPNRLIPTLILRGLRGQLPPLVNPDIARDYVYVDDVCDAYIAAAHTPTDEYGAVYNIGGGAQTSLREIVALARELMPISVEPQWGTMPDRAWDTSVWVANLAKIRATLKWEAQTLLSDGFARFIAWFEGDAAMRKFYENQQSKSP